MVMSSVPTLATVIAYASIYGNTELACQALAHELSQQGVRDVKLLDLSREHPSYVLAEAFRYSHLVLASVTYNGDLFPDMEHFILSLKAHGLKGRTIALMENGSWAPTAVKVMTKMLEASKNLTYCENNITIRSAMTEENRTQIRALAEELSK